MRFTSKLDRHRNRRGQRRGSLEMQHAVAVVILIDNLMMHRSVDLEPGDALELILARKRNPCLDMVRRRRSRIADFRMIGEAKIALPVRRRRIARRQPRSRASASIANENDAQSLPSRSFGIVETLRVCLFSRYFDASCLWRTSAAIAR